MEIKESYDLPLPIEAVWQALNDEDFLKNSIPGCEKLDRIGDNELSAEVKLKIGPMSTRFKGKVTLSELDPPNGYTISGSGTGGSPTSVSPTPNSLQQRDLHPIIGGRSWIQTESRRPLKRFGATAMRKAFSAGRHM